MKTKHSTLLHSIAAIFTVLILVACGGGGGGGGSSSSGGGGSSSVGSSSSTGGCTLSSEEIDAIDNINDFPPECLASLPTPEENLLGRMFILGTQVDPVNGDLRIFVSGTDADGNLLQLANFQTATVSVAGNPADPGLVSVAPVAAGDEVLSLGFTTDYSTSISDAELDAISTVYSAILNSLPPVLEAEVINFSSSPQLRQDWTEDAELLHAAFQRDNSFVRQNTALYDAIGFSLKRNLTVPDDGLIERCRPAHMQVVFTDGADNASNYTKSTLLPIIEDSKTVMIMLGGLNADKDTLVELAGNRGAFVYAYNLANIQNTVGAWAGSLSNMVLFTLDPATGFDAGGITIELGGQAIAVERPTDGFCQSTL